MPPRHQIDRLPPDTRETINRWLANDGRTVDEFTGFLAELLAPLEVTVARSSAHRYMVRRQAMAERLRQSREMTAALAQELPDAAMQGKQGRMLVEMARTFVHDLLAEVASSDEVLDPKSIANIGKGLAELARAARLDQDFEAKVKEVRREEREASADKAAAVAKARGISAETVKGIRHAILGVGE